MTQVRFYFKVKMLCSKLASAAQVKKNARYFADVIPVFFFFL